jgi:hypothetical protein
MIICVQRYFSVITMTPTVMAISSGAVRHPATACMQAINSTFSGYGRRNPSALTTGCKANLNGTGEHRGQQKLADYDPLFVRNMIESTLRIALLALLLSVSYRLSALHRTILWAPSLP